jgi:hypothetical protein
MFRSSGRPIIRGRTQFDQVADVCEHFKEVGIAGVLVILPEMVYEEIFDHIENLAVAVHARLDVVRHDLLRGILRGNILDDRE